MKKGGYKNDETAGCVCKNKRKLWQNFEVFTQVLYKISFMHGFFQSLSLVV
jgi:hypothetical protein